jgi:Dolichyl-phosphate-mannose-protein mannosyltransferase
MSTQQQRPAGTPRPATGSRGHSASLDIRPGVPDAETVIFAAPKTDPETDDPGAADGALEQPDSERESTQLLDAIRLEELPEQPVPHSSPRRKWISRGVVVVFLALQAALSLRMHNTAFEDEALYIYVGHLEIAHWLHGSALQGNYASYFSGAPVLYPPLAAAADSIGGLAAARAVSLIEMLATTSLLYSVSRQLFNERVALCAVIIFSVSEPTIFLGHLATYDASALLLLAFATWIVVRTAAFSWPAYLLAAPVVAVAVATKYASLLFVPTIVVLAGLAAWPQRGRRAIVPPAALTAAIAGLIGGALYLSGPNYRQGVSFTTLQRFEGTSSAFSLIWDSVQWGGLAAALAIIGAAAYAARPFTEPGEDIAPAGTRARRILLGVVLAGSALLATAEQVRIHTLTSLWKHIGFGLFLAAPIAGVGLARVIGDHFRRTQVGIAIWGAALVLGMSQANNLFNAWPNESIFVADMAHYLQPGAQYLVEVDEVPIYYLRHYRDAQPEQFTSTYYIGYLDPQGKLLTGNAGYVAAIKAGYFQVVAYNYQTTPSVDAVLAKTLATDPSYRLAAAIPNGNDTVTQYIWVKV